MKAASRAPKTAQRGKTQWISCDPLSTTILNYAKHIISNHLTANASNSTVVRRALVLYQAHIQYLASPLALKRDHDAERRALLAANRGDLRSISAGAFAALPTDQLPPSLTRMLAPRPDGSSIRDMMRADLAKWHADDAAHAKANGAEPPWDNP